MHYLIDGHNLIGKMTDISLSDPDDEVKLVLRLRSWTSQRKKRQVTVIFDGGIPGGKEVRMSTPDVRVHFASEGKTADSSLINRIQKIKTPGEYTVVSSDNQILEAAKARRMPVMKSEKFAMRLGQLTVEEQVETAVEDDSMKVSEEEVAQWLELFGPVPEREPPPKPVRKKKLSKARSEKKRFDSRNWHAAKRAEENLDDEDVSDWLRLFGEG